MKTLIAVVYIVVATISLLVSTNASATAVTKSYDCKGDPECLTYGPPPPHICPDGVKNFYTAQRDAANYVKAEGQEEKREHAASTSSR